MVESRHVNLATVEEVGVEDAETEGDEEPAEHPEAHDHRRLRPAGSSK